MKKRMLVTAGIVLGAGAWYLAKPKPEVVTAAGPSLTQDLKIVAAAGRVEPLSEEIKIASELDGRLKRVYVEEGQSVRKGQIVAELENADFAARVALAKASIASSEAAVDRLVNGSRKQERAESSATVREAEAVLENARRERDRRQILLDRGAISRTEFDTADREYQVAAARLDAVKERRALVDDATRPEDLARARAEVALAVARLAESQAMLAKTIIRSPIDAVVLRKKLKAGESVSSKGEIPIVTLGNVSQLRIRVDVDENDVGRIAVGQTAWVTAAAYGDRKFTGKVVEIGKALGRKNVRTDEPTERADVKILETLVALDAGQPSIPVGLRVDAFIQVK